MTIGVIGAMQMEVDDLKAQMTDTQTEVYSGVEFVEGKIGDQYVVAAKCGIGKVFAAICAEAMILKYDVDMIVNIGVAGTLTKDLNVLDVAVATNVLQHDMDTSPIGDPKGLLSGINMILLPADTKMVELMCSCLADRNIHYKKGNIATGDQFIATKEQKDYISNTFDDNRSRDGGWQHRSCVLCEQGAICHSSLNIRRRRRRDRLSDFCGEGCASVD